MERVGYRHPLTSRSRELKSFSRQNVLCPASVSLFTEWHHFHDVGRELMKSRWGFAWPLHCLPWKLPAHTHTDTHKWSFSTYLCFVLAVSAPVCRCICHLLTGCLWPLHRQIYWLPPRAPPASGGRDRRWVLTLDVRASLFVSPAGINRRGGYRP